MFFKSMSSQNETIEIFDALIERFPDMVHSVDGDGKIVYVNGMASALLGYTADELYAMNIRQLYPPEILDSVEKGFNEVKQTGEKHVESLLLAKDGSRIPVELRTLVIHDAEGAFARTFTVSRDMRKLKELQENMIHTERLAAIGELAAGVVHDLNNPLTAIILASAMMAKIVKNPALTPEAFREQTSVFCETIRGSAATMEALTSRLRDFARGIKEQHAPVDLFDPLHDAIFILAHRILRGNVRVLCPVARGHWVMGDRNQIEQVFLNLFANACDAMGKSAVRDLVIEISTAADRAIPCWSCTVRDTGEGIPPAVQERMFQSFFTTKPRGKGTGLGLSIARSIVLEHGGQIGFSSEPGAGTTFTVLFPIHRIA